MKQKVTLSTKSEVMFFDDDWRQFEANNCNDDCQNQQDLIDWFGNFKNSPFIAPVPVLDAVTSSEDFLQLFPTLSQERILDFIGLNKPAVCEKCNQSLKRQFDFFSYIENNQLSGTVIFAVSVGMLLERDKLKPEVAADFYQFRRAIKNQKIIRIEDENTARQLIDEDWFIAQTASAEELRSNYHQIEDSLKIFGEWSIYIFDNVLTKIEDCISQNYCSNCKLFITDENLLPKKLSDFGPVLKELFDIDFTQYSLFSAEFLSLCQKIKSNLSKTEKLNLILFSSDWVELLKKMYPNTAFNFYIPSGKSLKGIALIDPKNLADISFLPNQNVQGSLLNALGLDKVLLKLIKSTQEYRKSGIQDNKLQSVLSSGIDIYDVLQIKLFDVSVEEILNLKIGQLSKIFFQDKTFTEKIDCLIASGLGELPLKSKIRHLSSAEISRVGFFARLLSDSRRKSALNYKLSESDVEDLGEKGFQTLLDVISRVKTDFQQVFVWASERDIVAL